MKAKKGGAIRVGQGKAARGEGVRRVMSENTAEVHFIYVWKYNETPILYN